MRDIIYLDNAATTQTAEEVYEAMKPFFDEYYGNAASVYRFAGQSTKAVDEARALVADFLGAKPKEIYFTSGGSESDNWALKAIKQSTIRLSIGTEHIDDIIADLEKGFAALK